MEADLLIGLTAEWACAMCKITHIVHLVLNEYATSDVSTRACKILGAVDANRVNVAMQCDLQSLKLIVFAFLFNTFEREVHSTIILRICGIAMRHQSHELFEVCVSFLCHTIPFNKGPPLERHHCLDPIIQQVPTSVLFAVL